MKRKPTIEQQKELVSLAAEHGGAIVAYGSHLYNQGIVTGALLGVATWGLSAILSELAPNFTKTKK